MARPKAFIAIEKTMSATMRVEWDRAAREFLQTLHPLIADENWHEAHDAVNKLSMRGVVSKVRAKIEELAVTAVLFGAHHVTGSVEETTLFKTKAIPQSLHHGVSQLVVAVEQNGGDYLRKQLHAVITALQRKDEKAHVQKENPNHDNQGRFASAPGGGGGVLLHGTRAAETVLTEGFKDGFQKRNLLGDGVYLTDDLDFAKGFGDVIQVDISGVGRVKEMTRDQWGEYLRTPAVRALADELEAAYKASGISRSVMLEYDASAGTKLLVSEGFDGHRITYPSSSKSKTSTVVYDPAKLRPIHVLKNDLTWYYVIPTTHVQKDANDARGAPEDAEGAGDLDETQLARTGGFMVPSQAGLGHKRKKRKMRKGTKTLYVNRPLMNADEVIAWAHTQGFKNVQQASDMHVTICYSKEPFDWDQLEPDKDTVKIVAGARELHAFGKAGDAIVLTFESPELLQEHQAFGSAGASYDFPEYKSHITVTWQGAPRPLAELEPYRGPLIFGPQEFAPINDDWKEAHVETVLRKAAGVSLADQLNEAVLRGGQMAIDVGANLTTSRLVSFGFLSEAHAAGAESYQVNEVLDGKTCQVCRYMHGKTFRVDSEYSRTLQALSTGDPNDLASISPWPDQSLSGLDDLFGMSLGEMQGEGYGSPPYHPFCRGILVLVGSVEENVPLGGEQADTGDRLFTMGTEGEEAASAWDEVRVAALNEAIDALAEDDLKASAVASMEAGEFDAALETAQRAIDESPALEASGVKGWSINEIDTLKWSRFEVTDPEVFKAVDDAFGRDDFDGAEKLLTAWKDGDNAAIKVVEKTLKDDPDNDPSP